MRCGTCNKSSLFVPRLKTLENKETTNMIVEQDFFKIVVEVKDNNSFLYKIEIHSMYLNSIWLNLQFQFNGWINIQLNWIQIQLKTVGVQIGGKCIQYFLMNMSLEKTFNTQIWNDSFPCIFTWEWVNKFQFGIVQCMTIWRT